MRAFAIAGLIFLAACSGNDTAPVGETSAQRLYELDGAYRTVLEIAVAYRDACNGRPVQAQAICKPVVAEIRRADLRFAALRERFGDGAGSGDLSLAAVELALAELRDFVIHRAIANTGEPS